jgi:hypothetical protein
MDHRAALRRTQRSNLVELVRDFLSAEQALRAVIAGQRAGQLGFRDVQRLVDDSESSALFRVKERCHALFRGGDSHAPSARQALFDLAVGSLFHEAMKLRENLYQVEVYGPRIRALRKAGDAGATELLAEFERLLTATEQRLGEAFNETEALLDHTRAQFRHLLRELREEVLIARTLFASRTAVEQVFAGGIDALFAEVYGSAADGYVAAARSFLTSAYFEEAIEALVEAERRTPDRREDLRDLASYAEGMQAFVKGDFKTSLTSLARWADSSPPSEMKQFADLALSALARLPQLVEERDRASSSAAAAEIIRKLRSAA